MEIVFEILAWLAVEIIFPLIGEALAEWGAHIVGRNVKRRPNPVLAGIGSLLLGLFFGVLSLWLMPEAMLKDRFLRFANLIGAPLLVGTVMVLFGRWRTIKGKRDLTMSRFANAYLLAFGIAVVRFFWAA